MSANPEIVKAIIAALHSTPEFQFLARMMEEDGALGRPVKHTHSGRSAEVEKYQARIHDAVLSIHSAAARQGKNLSWKECHAQAISRYGAAPAGPDKYFEQARATVAVHEAALRAGKKLTYTAARAIAERATNPEKYEQRLAEAAVDIHSQALARGESWDYGRCKLEAARRIGSAA